MARTGKDAALQWGDDVTTTTARRPPVTDRFRVALPLGAASAFKTSPLGPSHSPSSWTKDQGLRRHRSSQAPSKVSATFPNFDKRTAYVSWSTPAEVPGVVVNGYSVTRYLGTTPNWAGGTSPTSLATLIRGRRQIGVVFVQFRGARRLSILDVCCHQRKRRGACAGLVVATTRANYLHACGGDESGDFGSR